MLRHSSVPYLLRRVFFPLATLAECGLESGVVSGIEGEEEAEPVV